MTYYVSADSYVCIADAHAVFLDLGRDKYTALPAQDARALESLVAGWPRCGNDVPAGHGDCGEMELAEELTKEGLLTKDRKAGKVVSPVNLSPATRSLSSVPGEFPKVTWMEFRHFISAWARATVMLRSLPLKTVVYSVRKRKARTMPMEPLDIARARRLMMAYFIFQPNFFSGVDNCLRNSLTFTEFFASYGLYPTWVFGVKMGPFRAHSWVQDGDVVLNDQVRHVRAFTPIMRI